MSPIRKVFLLILSLLFCSASYSIGLADGEYGIGDGYTVVDTGNKSIYFGSEAIVILRVAEYSVREKYIFAAQIHYKTKEKAYWIIDKVNHTNKSFRSLSSFKEYAKENRIETKGFPVVNLDRYEVSDNGTYKIKD